MTNTKAQVGDLIRITDSEDAPKGRIYEVIDVDEYGDAYVGDTFSNGDTLYFCDYEYAIHRKAGEEDSPYDTLIAQGRRGIEQFQAEIYEGESVVPAQSDAVNSPQHYKQGRVEVIDVIEQFTSGYNDGFTAHCIGTATKYIARAPYKHATPLEDLRKAARYLAFAIEHEQRKTDASK